jgi:TetR/AcrR family transcriptional repressor of nem operon
MRYTAEHKEETRQKILKTAARRFRETGGTIGIADLMRELDLTHGGFYRHFESKDQLFGESLGDAFEDIRAAIATAVQKAPPGRELHAIIESYLSERHCANVAGGCPVAALAGEVGRAPRKTKQSMERWTRDHISRVSRFFPGSSEEERRSNALILFSGMSGTVAVARTMADKKAREALLAKAREFYINAFL